MTYVGQQPTTGDFKKLDSITTSSATTFNLRQGSVAVYPQSANHCIVSLNGVIQSPVDAFTIVNDTIVFASSLASSDVINFILVLGNVNDIGVPSDDTITNAKLSSNLISGETDIGGALADADLILVDDGAGGTLRKSALSRMKTYIGGGISNADQWRQTATTSSSSGATVTANWEQADTDGFGALGSSMTESSGTFTFPSTGYWLIMWHGSCKASGGAVNSFGFEMRTTLNNSSYSSAATGSGSGAADDHFGNVACFHIFDVTSTTNCKVQMYYNSSATGIYQADTDRSVNALTFLRLADT